jgi:hypothetical protein
LSSHELLSAAVRNRHTAELVVRKWSLLVDPWVPASLAPQDYRRYQHCQQDRKQQRPCWPRVPGAAGPKGASWFQSRPRWRRGVRNFRDKHVTECALVEREGADCRKRHQLSPPHPLSRAVARPHQWEHTSPGDSHLGGGATAVELPAHCLGRACTDVRPNRPHAGPRSSCDRSSRAPRGERPS